MRQSQEKEHLLKLTSAVYKVTALFPVEEYLGLKIRKLADSILFGLLHQVEQLVAPPGGATDIEEILMLFNEAEKKNWVDSRNFLVLKREYSALFGLRHRTDDAADLSNNNRQEKIMAVMAGNGAVKIGDLVKIFPKVNRRTVLRDLEVLCQTGAMVRNGIGRGAFYVKNGHKKECDIPEQMS